MTLQSLAPSQHLYEHVADRIRTLITEKTLQPGDRLPSVRKLHEQFSVSISTVLEAYRLLEDQGLIGARPQSGYFVKQSHLFTPDEPKQSALPKHNFPVEVSLAYRVGVTMRDPNKVKLGAAVPGLELLPIATLNRLMSQIIRTHSEAVHSYSIAKGCESLHHEVAKRLIDAGCSINPNEIVITNGTTEAVYLSLRAVTKPGDTVAIESPCYYGILEALESLHLKALELPTHPQEGISLDHLEAALEHRQIAACALVPNFSNPLGSCMSDVNKQHLVTLLNQYDIPLIEDDIYGDLHFEGTRPKAVKAFDTEGRVLYCASASKTLSPGLRVGWSVPGRYQLKIEQLKMAMNWMTSIASQLTVAAFLGNGGYDRHLRQLRRAYQSQIIRMTQAVCDYFPAETKVTRPSGGYVLWLELSNEFEAMALYEEALDHQISVAPGVMFSPSGNYANCLRLNCGLPWTPEIDRAMQTLGYLTKRQLARKMLNE
ncbi:PLP-dependent aminotransferase family protein [Phormidesmis priestleyi ULC007]|uniref:PLP-dependent aminotransferase family protein n=1 Tax=Phormidesmis priestleyi ULC007 TaxID=1920490 RepID=A0A2T1DDT2_9CYAN|nr:PLP-dependent aminotransferase family protein [Phormidesmis priestleyi]PSB18670.1 PLP-dependent aminotransferase family protein [Phormidesmis priestleyi ULC007]PZO51569.1 MAG: PLP-dependent aminotransferase family protein [Phormidesmis priestleyi]